MTKLYIYSRISVILGYGMLFVAISIIGGVSLLAGGIPTTKETWILASFLAVFILTMWSSVLVWIIIVLKIKIYTDDQGIKYISPFKQHQIAWNEISEIERKYYYSGSFPTGGPPRDMLIKTTTGKSLRVFYFLINSETMDTEEGIKDFESEIRNHTSLSFE